MARPSTKGLSRSTRALLACWPEGEVREAYVVIRQLTGQKGAQLDRAVDGGWLQLSVSTPVTGPIRLWTTKLAGVTIQRTALPCTPYTPRGPRANYAETHVWPWSVDEHWRRVEQAPIHRVPAAARQLNASLGWHVLHWSAPVRVTTKSDLAQVRDCLTKLFDGKRTHYIPAALYLSTPAELHALLCELLVRPVLHNGVFHRFAARDPQEAHTTWQALRGRATSVLELYMALPLDWTQE